MLLTVIISAITCLAMVLSVLFFPRLRLGKVTLSAYWLITLAGALVLLLTGCVDIGSVGTALLANTAINPIKILLLFLSKKIGALTYYASVPFHYNFLPCIAGAVGLFAFFAHVRLPEGFLTKTVRFWSPAVFGVYLIHEHVDVSLNWCRWMTPKHRPSAQGVR